MALHAYFDSSGGEDSAYLTLAAFAGSEGIWNDFNEQWRSILQSHDPKADYLHMREAAHLKGAFSESAGWTEQKAFSLPTRMLMYMQTLPKKAFRMFACTVDRIAHQKLLDLSFQIESPTDLCNRYCSEAVLAWYVTQYPELVHSARFIFDKGEPFRHPFETKWRQQRKDPYRLWRIIKSVEAKEMKLTPGLQAADMLAWASNREQCGYAKARHMCHIMKQVIPSTWVVWNEQKLRKHYEPLIWTPERQKYVIP